VNAFDVLGDPVRRRILDELAAGESTAGEITAAIQDAFGISQPAVSHHLRVLRESGFVAVRREGTRRIYTLDFDGFEDADEWLGRFRRLWVGPLEALATEVARGKRERNGR
jgi:DNA-binding transcriptional ArsR family regulator